MTKRYLESRNPNLKPNVKTFTAVLNACARPVDESERNDAFEIAETTMAELSQGTYDKPNFLSYAAFLSVCCSTVAPGEERDVIVRKKFKECIEAGEVAKLVLTKLRIAATPSLYEELVGKYKQDDGSLQIPQGWKASIKGERSEAEDVTNTHAKHRIPRSSYLRLEAVQKSCGQSGFYSGNAPARPEGVTWSQRPLGADQ